MPNIIAEMRSGQQCTIDADAGRSLMEVLRDGGVDEIAAICGGACACATCHVHVAADWLASLPPMSDDELELLDGSMHRRASSRLSCQIPIVPALDGLRVTVAPED